MAAFLFAQGYFSVYPLLPSVPAALFWFVVAVLFAGVVAGCIALVRVTRAERVRGIALAWLAGAIVVELVCLAQFLSMTVPWLL